MSDPSQIMDAQGIRRVLTRIAHEVLERNEESNQIALVGIQRGGVYLAERLAALLNGACGHPIPCGKLDVGMHRDDLDRQLPPEVHPTEIPFDVNGKSVVLIDDVLYSGRTTRAAMDALNDFGRPKKMQLAVLVDRGHRELPIKADYVGRNVTTRTQQRVDVRLKESGGDDSVWLVDK